MIEIMIALLLGAFLIGGVMQIFINTRQTYLLQESLSRLQENGRLAMNYIGRDLRMVDYRFCPSKPRMNDSLAGTDGNNANNPDSPDTITIRWSERLCTDTANTFSRNLVYAVNTATRIFYRNAYSSSNFLADGVENMQVLYGVDTDGNGIPNYYDPAPASMELVVAVRISLLLSTDDNVTSIKLPYVFNNEQSAGVDRRLRRVFTSTFALRNRIQ